MARLRPKPRPPARRAPPAALGLLLVAMGCSDMGCEAPPGELGPDAGSSQAQPPGTARADGLRLELRVRERYPLGAEAWAELQLVAPEPGGERLRTRSLVAVVDGRELPDRPWTMEWPLRRAEPQRLELGTLAGSAIDQEGAHTLALRFQAELLGGPGQAGAPAWRGELASGTVSFARVALRPEELVRAVPSPRPDPSALLEIRLHLGGRPLPVWPPSAAPVQVVLPALPPRASLWVTGREPLPVDLAYAVMLAPGGPGQGPRRIGALRVEGAGLGPEAVLAGELELPALDQGQGRVSLRLELQPSAEEAARAPGITRYWDQPLTLSTVEVELPTPPP